jgi:hypothetical protein
MPITPAASPGTSPAAFTWTRRATSRISATSSISKRCEAQSSTRARWVSYDFRDLLPHGITQWVTMNADPLAIFPPFTRIAAFTGSAMATGGGARSGN